MKSDSALPPPPLPSEICEDEKKLLLFASALLYVVERGGLQRCEKKKRRRGKVAKKGVEESEAASKDDDDSTDGRAQWGDKIGFFFAASFSFSSRVNKGLSSAFLGLRLPTNDERCKKRTFSFCVSPLFLPPSQGIFQLLLSNLS